MSSPTVKLNSGYDMPLVGFGLWKVDNSICADTVYNAIKAGYRLFDGACGMFHLAKTWSPRREMQGHERVSQAASLSQKQMAELRMKPVFSYLASDHQERMDSYVEEILSPILPSASIRSGVRVAPLELGLPLHPTPPSSSLLNPVGWVHDLPLARRARECV